MNGLIIFEMHMNKTFEHMIKINSFQYFTMNLTNRFSGNELVNIYKRVLSKKIINNKYNDLKTWIIQNDIHNIYLSSAEGYIANNIIQKIKKDFPNIILIALQHGFLSTTSTKQNLLVRNILNTFLYGIFGIYPFGESFGPKNTDQYIVYTEKYKNHLIDKFNWNDNDVQVDMEFLKSNIIDKYNSSNLQREKDTAVFFLQCLNNAGLCSNNHEIETYNLIIKSLSRKYSKLLIKQHPKCIHNLILEKNCYTIESLDDSIALSTYAYSISSASLLDAQLCGVTSIAIYVEGFHISKGFYLNNFKNIISLEKLIHE